MTIFLMKSTVCLPVDINIHDLSYLAYFFNHCLFGGAWVAVHILVGQGTKN